MYIYKTIKRIKFFYFLTFLGYYPDMIDGQKLRAARKKAGLTQGEAAEKLNKKRGSISYIEQGKFQPSQELVEEMAKLYGVEIEDFKKDYSQPGQLPPSLTESESLILNVWNRLDESGKVKLLATGQQLISQLEANETKETSAEAVTRSVLAVRQQRRQERKETG